MHQIKPLELIKMSAENYLKVWLQLAKSAKRIEQAMETRLQQEFGQSMSRFDVLSQLYRLTPGGAPMGKVGAQLLASRGNITRLVDRMVDEGLIERRADSHDRRVTEICITDKGLQLFTPMAAKHALWCEELLGGLDPAQAQVLVELLKQTSRELG